MVPELAVFRFRSRIIGRLNFVVNLDSSAVAQLEHARADDFLARVHPRSDRDLVATRGTNFYELLAHPAIAIALWAFQFSHDKNRITVRGVADCGCGQRNRRLAGTEGEVHLHEHTRTQFATRVGEGCLNLDVARGLVYHRIKRSNTTGKHLARHLLSTHANSAADLNLSGNLLRHPEVHIDRI